MLDDAYEFCKGFDTAVCAGGGVGVVPNKLAEKFKVVYAFEPESSNFACMAVNTVPTVIKIQAALGPSPSLMGMTGDLHDLGSWQIVANGRLPMVRLDSFNLPLHLLYLDANGFEPNIIEGAVKTLKAYKPVVIAAASERLPDYGHTLNFLKRDLKALGYELKKENANRMVFA